MRLGFDASVVFSSVGGTRVYALQLLRALMDSRPDWKFFLYVRNEEQARGLAQRFGSSNVHSTPVIGSPNTWRLQAALPAQLRKDQIDVYHSLGFFVPFRWHGPRVVTIHDLNVYLSWRHWMRPGKIAQWADMALQIPFAARAADRIITISDFSRSTIAEVLRVKSNKIAVIHIAPDPYFDEMPSRQELAQADELTRGEPFVLFVGILSAQKNLGTLVRGFSQSGIAGAGWRLVLAGSDREGEAATLGATAREAGIEDRVLFPGFVSNALLRALYHKASCLVLPSHGEGFGLPLVEAMACGTPVIAANTQAMPEVVDDAGVLFDPDDVAGLAKQLQRMSTDTSFRDQLIQRGRARRAAFSWRSAAEATASVYEEVLRTRP